jgi:hypothetical protein
MLHALADSLGLAATLVDDGRGGFTLVADHNGRSLEVALWSQPSELVPAASREGMVHAVIVADEIAKVAGEMIRFAATGVLSWRSMRRRHQIVTPLA